MNEERIINSARELFIKYGIKKVSMNEIAKNAGVTKKTVYSYFVNKADLINYFIKDELNNMRHIVEEYADKNEDFFENVHQGLFRLLTYKKNSFFLNILINNTESFDVKILKDSLNKAKEKGCIEVQNIDITTFLIYKMYIALMFEWDEQYTKLNDKEIADNILQILKNGLSPKIV